MNIFYKPLLGLDKDYRTKGKIPQVDITKDKTIEPSEESISIPQTVERTKLLLNFTPSKVQSAIESSLDLIHFFYVIHPENESNNKDDKVPDYEVEEDKPEIVPPYFSKNHATISIKKEVPTESVTLQRFYNKVINDIAKDYLEKVRLLLTNYHTPLLQNKELEKYLDLFADDLFISSSDSLKKISYILKKSEYTKLGSLRLLEKLYNKKTALSVLKSMELSYFILLDFYKEAKSDFKMYERAEIKKERKKLDKKSYEYYKYLNSQLILIKEILDSHLKEAILKEKLYKKQEERK